MFLHCLNETVTSWFWQGCALALFGQILNFSCNDRNKQSHRFVNFKILIMLNYHTWAIKVQLFWKGHKHLKKISHLFWRYWVKTTVLSKQVGDFFQILWPSHNIWTLFATVCTFFTHFLEVKNVFSRRFFQKILPLCMVSILERFLIKSGLWWCAY